MAAFSYCCFCPEAEFWRSVWVGRHPKPGQGLLVKIQAPLSLGSSVSTAWPQKGQPQCLGVRYSFHEQAASLGSSPLCPVAVGSQEQLLLISYLCLSWEEGVGDFEKNPDLSLLFHLAHACAVAGWAPSSALHSPASKCER